MDLAAALNAVLGRVVSLPEMAGEPNEEGRSLVRRSDVLYAIYATRAEAAEYARLATTEPTEGEP